MKLSIASSKTISSTQPHFWQLHDRHLKEVSGEPCYEIPYAWIVQYLEKNNTQRALEGIHLALCNYGISFRIAAWKKGERDVGKLFVGDATANLNADNVIHYARILMDKRNHPDVHTAVNDFLGEVGLEPNMERIGKEFCVNCAKQASPAPKAA